MNWDKASIITIVLVGVGISILAGMGPNPFSAEGTASVVSNRYLLEPIPDSGDIFLITQEFELDGQKYSMCIFKAVKDAGCGWRRFDPDMIKEDLPPAWLARSTYRLHVPNGSILSITLEK